MTGKLRTAEDADWATWMALNAPTLGNLGPRVEFWMFGSPAYPSGGAVVQRNMVNELRSSGYAVRVLIVDTAQLAEECVAEVLCGSMGRVAILCDCISVLCLRTHLLELQQSSFTMGIACVVHLAFSSDENYLVSPVLATAAPEAWIHDKSRADCALLRQIEVAAYAACDLIVAVSEQTSVSLRSDYGVSPDVMYTTEPAAPSITRVRPTLGTRTGCHRDDMIRFVTVGSLCKSKNQLVLVEALSKLGPHLGGRSWQLDIVGSTDHESSYVAELRGCIDALELCGHITLRGALAQAEVFELLRGSDLFLFPSLVESFGMAVREAAAVGLPVVAYEGVGHLRDFLSPDAVRWVHTGGGADAWADAINAAAECSADLLAAAAVAATTPDAALESYSDMQRVMTDVVRRLAAETA